MLVFTNTLFVPLVGAALLCAVPVFPVAGGALGDAGPPVSSQPVPIGAGAVVRAWSVLTLHRAETSPIVLRTLIDICSVADYGNNELEAALENEVLRVAEV